MQAPSPSQCVPAGARRKVLLHGIRAGRRAAGAPICWEASRGRRAGRSAADANSVEKHFSCCATARGACVAVPLIDPVIRRFSGRCFYPGLYFSSRRRNRCSPIFVAKSGTCRLSSLCSWVRPHARQTFHSDTARMQSFHPPRIFPRRRLRTRFVLFFRSPCRARKSCER